MASLFEAIIQQNLSVLTRGNTLRPTVLLLGGPNTYIPAMRDCWKHNIPKVWAERKTELPEGIPPEDLIIVRKTPSIMPPLARCSTARPKKTTWASSSAPKSWRSS